MPDPIGSYSAVLTWGDGTTTTTANGLTIAAVTGRPGTFSITAPAHTYANPGLYPIAVTVNDIDPTSGSGGGTAIVAAASVTASASTPISGVVEGQAIAASTSVATFVSGDPAAVVAGFTAVIDWGDGTASTPGVITQPGGVGTAFRILGGHTYEHHALAGHVVTVKVMDAYDNASVAFTAVNSIADAALSTGTVLPVVGALHQPLNSVAVATFIDTNPSATAEDFSGAITWGDGSAADTNVRVVLVGGNATGAIFAVYGSHLYNTAGSFSISTLVNDKGGQPLTITSGSSNVTISQSTLNVNVLPVTTKLRQPIPANTVVGTFTDVLGAGAIGSYTATINWGDGSAADSAVTLTSLGGNTFSVSSTNGHTYSTVGSYSLRLTVVNGPVMGIGGNLAVVNPGDAPILTPVDITAVEGQSFFDLVANFTDNVPGVVPTDFMASIDWGDGTLVSTGFVGPDTGSGNFAIGGGHTYAHQGDYIVIITLIDQSNRHVMGTMNATVSDAALSAPTGRTLTADEAFPVTQAVLGTFVDANPDASEGDFNASIGWGDGSANSTGFVTLVGNSGTGPRFSVEGTHTYLEPGTFTATITITDIGGSTTTILATVIVKPAQIKVTPAGPITVSEGAPTVDNQLIATFTHADNADAGWKLRRYNRLGRRESDVGRDDRDEPRRIQCPRSGPHLHRAGDLRHPGQDR